MLSMRIIKIIKTLLFVTLPTLLVLFIILELFFKFIIPASERPDGFFYEDEKMYSFSGEKITGLNTFGRFAEIKAKWHINNIHWNYPIDYYPAKDKPLIAVIGDSYIEAFQVDADKNYPYLLKEKVLPEYEVYAFGKSGAPLSQYLHISRYLNKHLKPDILIFNIVHNDFDESIDKRFPDRHHFLKLSYNEQDDTFTEIIPTPNLTTAQYKTWKRILYKSSLFRYLYFNIDIVNIRKQIINRKNNNQFEGNIIPEELQQHKNLIIKATDYLVKKIMDE